MSKDTIKLSLNYITNFQPHIPFDQKITISKSKNKIYLKNFFLFSLLMKHITKNNVIKIFIKPKYSSLQTILRPPYKNKISRHQLTLSRYFINISYRYFVKTLDFSNLYSVIIFVGFCKKFFNFFETNLCYQHRSRIFIDFYLKDYFCYSFHKNDK